MTLIAIALKGQSAEIVTDTASNTRQGAKFRRCSKTYPIHHLDMVMTASGVSRLSSHAQWHADHAATNVDSFDELVDKAPIWMDYAKREAGIDFGEGLEIAASIFLIGYSDRAEEFVGYVLRAATDFTPEPLPAMTVQPTPMSVKISEAELDRLCVVAERMHATPTDIAGLRARWLNQPEVTVPRSAKDWVKLAEEVRSSRVLSGPQLRTWVAGEVVRTTLHRGRSKTEVIHQFDDTGENLRKMLDTSLHPLVQRDPCPYCYSGLPGIDCCQTRERDAPCECGSRKIMRDCCMVAEGEEVPRSLWTSPFQELVPYADLPEWSS